MNFFKHISNKNLENITIIVKSSISGLTWKYNIYNYIRDKSYDKLILEFNINFPDEYDIDAIKTICLYGYEADLIINCSKTEQNDKQLLEILEKLKDELGELELITINRNQINKQFIKKCVIKL